MAGSYRLEQSPEGYYDVQFTGVVDVAIAQALQAEILKHTSTDTEPVGIIIDFSEATRSDIDIFKYLKAIADHFALAGAQTILVAPLNSPAEEKIADPDYGIGLWPTFEVAHSTAEAKAMLLLAIATAQ